MNQIRHDHLGFYQCTEAEAAHEDAGNPSVGFDGREHYATLEMAHEAFGIPQQPTAQEYRDAAFDLFATDDCTVDTEAAEVFICEEDDGAWVTCTRFVRKTDVPGFEG